MFDAFLRHARGGDVPTPASPRVALTPVVRPTQPPDEPDETTKVLRAPERPRTSLPAAEPSWDDRTEENGRPSAAESEEGPTDVAVSLPPGGRHAHAMEESIIIEDDSLTQPEMGRDPVVAASSLAAYVATAGELDLLLSEMAVLVKYGHGPQAGETLNAWAHAHGDDLQAQLRVAEFEMARVDREMALRRYGTLVSLFLDRGDLRSAGDVMRRLRRDMPDDPRVAAIAQWNGLDL